MTEQEMRNRMKEIDNERNKLKEEREIYEKYFSDKKSKERLEDRKQYIGKCFISKNEQNNKQKQIKAFKILEIIGYPNERYTQGIALIDGYESNCWNVKAVKIQVIGLWTYNENKLMNNESDPKVIDFYEEISQEEFEKLYREYQNDLDNKVYS